MKTLFSILFLLFGIIGLSQNSAYLLEKAYKEKSIEHLNQFFQNWNQEIQPLTDVELLELNDTIREAYYVFMGFYKPQSIDSLGGSEWGGDIYKDVSYVVVQDFIKIYFADKVYYSESELDSLMYKQVYDAFNGDTSKINSQFKKTNGQYPPMIRERFGPNIYYKLTDSIIDFRPQINCAGKLPLYMTPKYDDILNEFLGDKHLSLGSGGIMNPARSKGESEKRKEFLENFVKIWYGHWGGYWQLYSYPVASSIIFDKHMKYAKVNFRMVYEGGQAMLKNENGKWVIISAKRTWIE